MFMYGQCRAKCFLFLNQLFNAKKAFQDAVESIQAVDNLKTEMKEAFIAQINSNLKKIKPAGQDGKLDNIDGMCLPCPAYTWLSKVNYLFWKNDSCLFTCFEKG